MRRAKDETHETMKFSETPQVTFQELLGRGRRNPIEQTNDPFPGNDLSNISLETKSYVAR